MSIGNQDDVYVVDGREIPFPHLDKPLFTFPEVTKRQLADHYERVAPVMLPYVRDRPRHSRASRPVPGRRDTS